MVSWLVLAALLQALEKKGISHLDEKDLKERNKRIQEDNRLELQKVGSASLCPSYNLTQTAQLSQLLPAQAESSLVLSVTRECCSVLTSVPG